MGYGKGAQKIILQQKWYNGLRTKRGTHVESRTPDGWHGNWNFDEAIRKTKGLKILKIKRDELFAVINKSL